MVIHNGQLAHEKLKLQFAQSFGKDVCNLISRRYICDLEILRDKSFPKKVAIYLNMLGPFIENWILRYV